MAYSKGTSRAAATGQDRFPGCLGKEGGRKSGLLPVLPRAQGWLSTSSPAARPGTLWVPLCIMLAGRRWATLTGLLLSDWREQCTVLVAGAEISKEDPREESWAGDATPGMSLPVWPWSPIPGTKGHNLIYRLSALCLVLCWSQHCGCGAQECV